MKKVILNTLLLTAIAVIAVSCSKPQPVQTIESLKAAIKGESNASATYKAFSAKAAEDGLPNIAKMFVAAAEAEAIHVKNHNAVLLKLGELEFTAEIKTPEVSDMKANLKAAIDGETYEFTVMYPSFITIANAEKCPHALRSFTWARDAEATHAKLYTKVLDILNTTGNDETISAVWFVCPKCGDLFDTIEGLDNCPLCGTNSASFLKF